MSARHVRGSIAPNQVVKRSVDSALSVDWDIMDRLRDPILDPDQLRSWYLGCDRCTQKRIRDHIAYKACVLIDQETIAFDLVCALLDDSRIGVEAISKIPWATARCATRSRRLREKTCSLYRSGYTCARFLPAFSRSRSSQSLACMVFLRWLLVSPKHGIVIYQPLKIPQLSACLSGDSATAQRSLSHAPSHTSDQAPD